MMVVYWSGENWYHRSNDGGSYAKILLLLEIERIEWHNNQPPRGHLLYSDIVQASSSRSQIGMFDGWESRLGVEDDWQCLLARAKEDRKRLNNIRGRLDNIRGQLNNILGHTCFDDAFVDDVATPACIKDETLVDEVATDMQCYLFQTRLKIWRTCGSCSTTCRSSRSRRRQYSSQNKRCSNSSREKNDKTRLALFERKNTGQCNDQLSCFVRWRFIRKMAITSRKVDNLHSDESYEL